MMALQKIRPSVLQQFVRTSTYMVYPFAPSRVLKNVFEGLSARRKLSKKRSLHPVNEHFETIFNTAIATQVVFQ